MNVTRAPVGAVLGGHLGEVIVALGFVLVLVGLTPALAGLPRCASPGRVEFGERRASWTVPATRSHFAGASLATLVLRWRRSSSCRPAPRNSRAPSGARRRVGRGHRRNPRRARISCRARGAAREKRRDAAAHRKPPAREMPENLASSRGHCERLHHRRLFTAARRGSDAASTVVATRAGRSARRSDARRKHTLGSVLVRAHARPRRARRVQRRRTLNVRRSPHAGTVGSLRRRAAADHTTSFIARLETLSLPPRPAMLGSLPFVPNQEGLLRTAR
jgi:hypothetical protein